MKKEYKKQKGEMLGQGLNLFVTAQQGRQLPVAPTIFNIKDYRNYDYH